MIGLILCGGFSSWVDTDTGMQKKESASMVLEAINIMRDLNIPIKVSINSQQLAAFQEALPDTDFITDNLAIPISGPLHGLLSAHVAYPTEDIFALACDMPQITPFLVKELYTSYMQQKTEVFLFTNDGEPEPLCAIYTSAALQKTMTLLQQGKLLNFSMKFSLDHLNCCALPINEENKKYFQNLNAHADLNGL